MNSFIESCFFIFLAFINADEKRWGNNQSLFSREENLNLLKELRDSLEAERVAERTRLEAKKAPEMEQLKVELVGHGAEIREEEPLGKLNFLIETVLFSSLKVKTTGSKQDRYLGEYQKEVRTHTLC